MVKIKRNMMVGAAAALMGLSGSAFATTLYDSGGFEAPTFSVGTLPGQDGWVEQGAGFSDANVHGVPSGKPISTGAQAVTIVRDGLDSTGSTFYNVPLSVNHDNVVFIMWDMYVPVAADQDPDPIFESFGPGFSLEAYATGNKRIAAVGVDAADGSFYQVIDNDLLPGGGSTPSYTLNPTIQLEQWQTWQLILDFPNQAYYLTVDGTPVAGGLPFLESVDYAGGDRLTDGSLVPFATDQFYFDIEGEAYVDNYKIFDGPTVPEPASVAMLAGVGLLLARRRG